MSKRLTDRFVDSLAAPAVGRAVYPDTKAPGLELRVSERGVKMWSIRYRPKGSKRTRSTYGRYPAISLAEARARAQEIAAAAARGIDLPAQEERQREEECRAEKRPRTVEDLLDRYIEQYCRPNQRRWQLTERMFDMYVKKAIGKRSLPELRRGDIVELLDDLQNKRGLNAQVNRIRSQLVAALTWAVEHEHLDVNPAAAIKKRKIEVSRSRVLSDAELRAIWQAADKLSNPSRSLVKMLILTGARRDEARCLDWSEIDLERAVWTLPAARHKGRRDHEIPLVPAMIELLGTPGKGPVFTVNGRTPFAGQRRLKEILDRESNVVGWVFHDIRRTVSTGLASLHVGQDVNDAVLGHSKGSLASVYNRHDYLAAKQAALKAWANRVAVIVGDGSDATNVVTLRSS